MVLWLGKETLKQRMCRTGRTCRSELPERAQTQQQQQRRGVHSSGIALAPVSPSCCSERVSTSGSSPPATAATANSAADAPGTPPLPVLPVRPAVCCADAEVCGCVLRLSEGDCVCREHDGCRKLLRGRELTDCCKGCAAARCAHAPAAATVAAEKRPCCLPGWQS